MRLAGRTGRRGFFVGPVHVGFSRRSRELEWARGFDFLWCETDFPHGNGTGKTLRVGWRWCAIRVQFGGPQGWRRPVRYRVTELP